MTHGGVNPPEQMVMLGTKNKPVKKHGERNHIGEHCRCNRLVAEADPGETFGPPWYSVTVPT